MVSNRFKREANFIDGEWVQADNGGCVDVIDPATGDTIGTVPRSGASETRRAIKAAHRAFATYSRTTANDRAGLLRALHRVVLENQDELAALLVAEQGKPLAEAKGEIAISAAYVLWFAEEGRRVYGEIIPTPWPGRQLSVVREPVGVVAAITPWNFPSSMLARKLGPALATGCTVVVKPASQTPYSGLAWAALCEEAGFPKGVVNIVTGRAGEIGDEICDNPLVRKVTFTGSTEIGKQLIRRCADTVKKVSMELGGNAPFIVFDDADLDRAVEGAMVAKYRNSGQTCVSTNRFFVQAGIHDAFVSRLAERTRGLVVGSGMADGSQQGPLIDDRAVARMEDIVRDAVAQGARVEAGGKRHRLGGRFFEPTVITGAASGMSLAGQEIFGPLSAVFRFSTEAEVLESANATEYGLACYVYTSNVGTVHRMSAGLRYGLIGINEGLITTVEAPFGGLKESGLGKEGGRQGIEDYLDSKYICIGGLGL